MRVFHNYGNATFLAVLVLLCMTATFAFKRYAITDWTLNPSEFFWALIALNTIGLVVTVSALLHRNTAWYMRLVFGLIAMLLMLQLYHNYQTGHLLSLMEQLEELQRQLEELMRKPDLDA